MSSKARTLEQAYEAALQHVLDIAEKYIQVRGKVCNCPLCKSSLFSKTAQERIQKASEKAEKIKAEWLKEKEKEKVANKPSFAETLRETRDRYDYILEEHKTPDFVEIVGKIGGDVETARVYRDGSCCIK